MENSTRERAEETSAAKEGKKDRKKRRARGRTIHIKDIFLLLWNRRYVVFFFFLLVVSITGIWTAKTPWLYKATTRLVIEKETLDLFPGSKSVLAVDTTGAEYLNTQCGILKSSRTLAENVINALRLKVTDKKTGEERFMHPVELLRKISVVPIRETRLVDVSVTDGDRKQASEIANTLAGEFIKFDVTSKLEARKAAAQSIKQQLEQLANDVREAERAFAKFKQDNNIVSVQKEQNLLYTNLNALTAEASLKQRERLTAETVYNRVKDLSVEELKQQTEVADDRVMQQLQVDLLKARTQLDALSLRYGPKHEVWKAATDTVEKIGEQIDLTAQAIRDRLREAVVAAQQKEQKAIAELEEAQRRVHDFEGSTLDKYRSLETAVQTKTATYQEVLRRGTESEAQTGVTKAPTEFEERGTSNIRVVDRAVPPGTPFRPRPLVNIALAIVMGLALGCGSAFFLEYLHDEVKNPDDITEDLGQTLLAAIPKPKRKLASAKDMGRIVYDHPSWPVSEAYRNLQTNIKLMARDGRFPSLLVTSACPGEGKTTTAENLAIVISQHGERVVLLDTDMRRPRIYRDFGIKNSKGLVSYLAGDCSLDEALVDMSGMAQREQPQNGAAEITRGQLWILPCERRVPNPTEIIGSPKMVQLVTELKKKFDVLIFDSPPCQFSDPLLLARYADGIVAVIEAHKYTKPVIAQGLERLDKIEEDKILGVVLNKYDPKRAGGYGYYGYRSYYYYRYYDRYYYDYYSRSRESLPHRLFKRSPKRASPDKKTSQPDKKPQVTPSPGDFAPK